MMMMTTVIMMVWFIIAYISQRGTIFIDISAIAILLYSYTYFASFAVVRDLKNEFL